MKKAMLILLAGAMSMALFCAVGCSGPQDKEAAKAAVTAQLESFEANPQNYDSKFESYSTTGIIPMVSKDCDYPVEDFYKAYLDQFSYVVGDAVNGDKDGIFEVKVKITRMDTESLYDKFNDKRLEYSTTEAVDQTRAGVPFDETERLRKEYLRNVLAEEINNASTIDVDIKVQCEKDANNEWQVTTDGKKTLLKAL